MNRKKVAVIANTGLGDGLWMMVIANNFVRAGCQVTLYCDYLFHLASLFPHVTVSPYPNEVDLDATFEQHDQVIIQQYTPASRRSYFPAHVIVINKETLDQAKSYVLNLRDLCQYQFKLENSGTDLGLTVPHDWIYRANPKRVVIHPSSSNAWKNWPQKKYIALAKQLQEEGFSPHFTLPPAEALEWNLLLGKSGLPFALSSDWMSLTKFIYESGFLIGNDASAGHLASSLHIPTLSIFDRKSRAIFWRPGWGYSQIVLPPAMLFGRSLIKALWKRALSVRRVYRAFKQLSIR